MEAKVAEHARLPDPLPDRSSRWEPDDRSARRRGMGAEERVVDPADGGSSIEDVYAAERDGLVRLAAFVTGDVASAVELVQDAFADLHEIWGTVESPAAWLRSAVARRSVSWVRRRIVARRYLESQPRAEGQEPVDVAGRVRVRQAVARLRPQHRAVVFCRYYLDLSEADTAATLGVPSGTVKSRLARALRELEGALDGR